MKWLKHETEKLIKLYPISLNCELQTYFETRSLKSLHRKSEELGLKKSANIKFKAQSIATKQKWKEHKFDTEYTRLQAIESFKKRDQRGIKNPNWKHSKVPRRDRQCWEYTERRNKVFIRDKYTCQITGQISGVLEVHHIKSFKNYPKLRYDVANGVTLSSKFHKSIRRKEEIWESYFSEIVSKKYKG